jgi:hypothetical protein
MTRMSFSGDMISAGHDMITNDEKVRKQQQVTPPSSLTPRQFSLTCGDGRFLAALAQLK